MLTIWKCARCNHEWASRLPQKPARCARCKCANWDGPRRITYPFHDLKVGESVTIPWAKDGNGQTDARFAHNLTNSVSQEERLKGRRFLREGRAIGLKLTRLK